MTIVLCGFSVAAYGSVPYLWYAADTCDVNPSIKGALGCGWGPDEWISGLEAICGLIRPGGGQLVPACCPCTLAIGPVTPQSSTL